MTFTGILILLILAAIFASLGQFIIGYKDVGWVASAVLGVTGAFIALWLAGKFHLPPVYKFYVSAEPFPIVWVLFGTAVFVLIAVLFQKNFIRRNT
ncbi:MAG: hypothetical protein ABJA35_04685 [Parafilimonas sp.]